MSGLLLWLAAAGVNDAPLSVPTLRVVPAVSMTAEEIEENDDPCFVRVSIGLAGEASSADVLACSPQLAPRVAEAALTTAVEMTPTTRWPLSVTLRFDPEEGAVNGRLVGEDAVSRPTIRKGRAIVPEVSGVPLPRAGLTITCPVHMVVLETGRTVGAQADASCEGAFAQRAVDAARRQRFIPAHNAAGEAVEAPFVARYVLRRK
jgi:hypothetical protein